MRSVKAVDKDRSGVVLSEVKADTANVAELET